MEKFEIYQFDSMFYTQQEIEEMGLSLLDYDGLQKLAESKDKEQYTVAIHSPTSKAYERLSNYLGTFNKDKKVFLRDYGDSAIIVDFTFLYGFRIKEDLILFESSEMRDSEYSSTERLIEEAIGKAKEKSHIVSCYSQLFPKQAELAKSKQKLLELLS